MLLRRNHFPLEIIVYLLKFACDIACCKFISRSRVSKSVSVLREKPTSKLTNSDINNNYYFLDKSFENLPDDPVTADQPAAIQEHSSETGT